ncbi:unnamed protein product [Caenorhabditis brenneri]
MASSTPSNENDGNMFKSEALFDHTVDSKKPLAEDDFLFYFYLSQFQSPTKNVIVSCEEVVNQCMEEETTLNMNRQQLEESSKQDQEHDVFMYQLFTRKKCQGRAKRYLRKIEKKEKIRAQLSKILKLGLEQTSLLTSNTDLNYAQQKEKFVSNAKEESIADENNAQQNNESTDS